MTGETTGLAQPPVLDIFIGYDRQEVVAYHVLAQSLLERSSRPVRLTPVNLGNLAGLFARDAVATQSTEFSFSRFLTPYLSGKGTIRFPADQPIPVALVTKVLQVRWAENAAAERR